jgi:hypothetical protein
MTLPGASLPAWEAWKPSSWPASRAGSTVSEVYVPTLCAFGSWRLSVEFRLVAARRAVLFCGQFIFGCGFAALSISRFAPFPILARFLRSRASCGLYPGSRSFGEDRGTPEKKLKKTCETTKVWYSAEVRACSLTCCRPRGRDFPEPATGKRRRDA